MNLRAAISWMAGTGPSAPTPRPRRRRSGQDEMTALVKSVGDEADNVGSTSSKAGSRSSGAVAPLPPTRPFDLGGASSQKGVKEASN